VSAASETETAVPAPNPRALGLKPGELVRVRSASEIFATLDADGKLDGLPFMPEMIKYCGRTLPVTQRADATCAGDGLVRIMPDTVHLRNIRCDGSFHDGCQANCLMFWKEVWLERAADTPRREPRELDDDEQAFVDSTLIPAIRVPRESGEGEDLYSCQATEVKAASRQMGRLELDSYTRGLTNWKLRKVLLAAFAELVNRYQELSIRRLPKWLRIRGGERWPFAIGTLEKGTTPKGEPLNLQAGDLVRVKSKEAIIATLDTTHRNRGLSFDHEMALFCGKTARVQRRVTRIIEEKNGEMINIKSDCIVLEGVVCPGDFHRFCTRAIPSYWREIWLERVDESEAQTLTAPCVVTRWSRDPGAKEQHC
jgi:hypothetical protein